MKYISTKFLLIVVFCSVITDVAWAEKKFKPVTDAMLSKPAAENWLGHRGNLAGWGYSSLNQINTKNVDSLSLVWTSAVEPGRNEVTPLVYDGVLYLLNPNNIVQAMDARNGDLLWEYRRQLPEELTLVFGRSMAIYQDKLFMLSGDRYLLALDIRTGSLLWETEIGGKTLHRGAPIVADGKVFTGRSCGDYKGCYISAHDVNTGKELWRRSLIALSGEPGNNTWGDMPLSKRSVGAWGVGSYDSELKLLYWGTSVPFPYPEVARGTVNQDVLYSNSTLALHAETGEIAWYFQHLPRPNWDFDHISERILVDSKVQPDKSSTWVQSPSIETGKIHKLMTGIPGKNGVVWTLNRATGEFLWAKQTVKQNVIESIEPNTGKVTVNEAVIPDNIDDPYGLVCPSSYGGKNWMPGAYSPRTGAMYMPLLNTCMRPDFRKGLDFKPVITPGETLLGRLEAISVQTGETLWKHQQRATIFGALASAGNLVFAGDSDRRFRAFNAETGKVLWETILTGGVSGQPVSFSVDNTQYIAVTAGGSSYLSSAMNSIAGLSTSQTTNQLYVFALPNKVVSRNKAAFSNQHPNAAPAKGLVPKFTKVQLERGKTAYLGYCAYCHGVNMKGGLKLGLTGPDFFSRWGDRTALQLYRKMWETMPMTKPRSLSRSMVADILAYWYSEQGYEPGEKPLLFDDESLRNLRLNPVVDYLP